MFGDTPFSEGGAWVFGGMEKFLLSFLLLIRKELCFYYMLINFMIGRIFFWVWIFLDFTLQTEALISHF
jgi:hypothetical protein